MNYVYGEEVIIVNFIGDLIIIATVLLTRNKKISVLRMIIGAGIGVLYAFGAILWSNVMVNMPVKILVSFAMAFAISKQYSVKEVLLNAVLIIFISFVSAGCILFLSYFFTSSLYIQGGYIFTSNYFLTGSGMIIGCVSVNRIYNIINKYIKFDQLIYPCSVSIGDKKQEVLLLADSGNLLKTITGKNVIILDHTIFVALTGVNQVRFADYTQYKNYYQQLSSEFKLLLGVILAQTIHSSEYLLVIKIDQIHFKNGTILNDLYIASGNIKRVKGEFNGIFNPIILNRRYANENNKKVQ